MSSDHKIKLYGLTLPLLSDCSYEFEMGISILGVNTKTRELEFVIDWAEYWDGSLKDHVNWWNYANDNMIDMIYWHYSLAIRQKLLEMFDAIDYNDAEDNPYPDW